MDVRLIVILGCLAMTVLAIGIILFVIAYQKKVMANQVAENKFQQQLIEATLISEQNEREKIARNLHDDLGTSLNIIKLNFEKIVRNTDKPEVVTKVSNQIMSLLQQAISDVRVISRDLMPATLMTLGFIPSIRDLCRQISESTIVQMQFDLPDNYQSVSANIEAQLYRICQEITNNLIKHGKPSSILLKITNQTHGILVTFSHNGKGVSNKEIENIYALNKGVGLKSLESRLRMVNGKINYNNDNPENPFIEVYANIYSKN